MITVWLTGLLRRQRARLLGATAGVAVAVALIATLGSFLATSEATMTERAVHSVAVDWQVQITPGADTAAAARLVSATAGVRADARVEFAQTSGLSATVAGSTQTTGPGVVLGIPATYRILFPNQIRTLTGADTGVLLAQQTAANLHVAPGETISIGRAGLPAVAVTVAGIVELPQANSLFQTVGAAPTAQPAAPPDNVVLLPETQWHNLFNPLTATRPDLVSTQIHLRRAHALPADPGAAYTTVRAAARNLEARSAGAVLVGDNLGAALDAARGDAAYARVLFVFLGLPGAVLAALLTATVTSAGADRRRAEQTVLRARGATARQLFGLAAAEAAVIGAVGAVAGLAAAAVVNWLAFGSPRFGSTATAAVGWPAAAAAAGMAVAAATVLVQARREVRTQTVADARMRLGTLSVPVWARLGIDGLILGAAAVVFYATTGRGYQLVLAPEGVPAISVSYWAFAGPALLWIGAGLLTWRLADLLLGRGRPLIAAALRPFTGDLANTIAAGMSRARRPLVRAIVMLTLAVAFAASTATFNATYRQQAEVDAQLTNGADVTVTATAPLPAEVAGRLAAVPGVRAVEPMAHRFAYIGADLQDLYGVRPASITRATALQDSYFPESTARARMSALVTRPDSILLSAETVHDFQLRPGDQVTLRIVDASTRQPRPVTFRYAGVVTEFPTAPKDSFLVANADYLAAQTGAAAPNEYLIDTGGRDTAAVAARIRAVVGTGATVTDINAVRADVGSSLTAVDLSGLTRIELSFALVLAVGAGALVLGLGLTDRRRIYALLSALGAHRRHLRAMVFSETAILTTIGIFAGGLTGSVLSVMLVKVLSGVFDPPPDNIAVPWTYLGATAAVTVGALGAVSAAAVLLFTRHPARGLIRNQ
ncbi:ABC transporter permease [Mycolicibacterium aromaticivorans JS19b1 = JCM 16368]|uniref:ABC transporter permease n=1 Tax=Mycolicibacterium aromaticivorans JS19b1 = JCM 16368 TaxID=1440774 RepID=A0A064CBP0_9MYCO|nr:ABC transporter permease [Mycolicibacterium aromaticivorans]KDE97096.1 ABC transporter permease [Mycolicibacterium aromaticivorans JS19b1 = JCM 16368]